MSWKCMPPHCQQEFFFIYLVVGTAGEFFFVCFWAKLTSGFVEFSIFAESNFKFTILLLSRVSNSKFTLSVPRWVQTDYVHQGFEMICCKWCQTVILTGFIDPARVSHIIFFWLLAYQQKWTKFIKLFYFSECLTISTRFP